MQQPISAKDQGKDVLKREREQAGKQGRIHHFIRWDREKQIQTFLAWLPQELIDAPGITWTELSPDVMGYCVRTIGQSPDAAALAVAAASMHGAIGVGGRSQAIILKRVFALLRRLRSTTSMQSLADLQQEPIWFAWAEQQEKTAS